MKKSITMSLNVFLASMAALMLCVPVAEAKDRGNNGNGSVEFSIPINYTESSSITGANGSTADVNAALSTGFALSYNINDYFQLGGSFSWGNRNYSATVVCTSLPCTSNYNGTLSTSSLQMNALWYFLPGDFTPFASAGFGTTFVDSNIPNGTGSSSCYWDPYWGYVCGTYQPTKSSTNISYSFGLGARYDFSRQFALQGSLNRMYIDGPNSKPQADMIRVDFVFRM
jgi:hypothetical protein